MDGITKEFHTQSIRAAAILTDSYVASTIVRGDEYNFLGIQLAWTKGSLTSFELKIEGSNDGINYFQQITEITVGGAVTPALAYYTTTTAGSYNISVYPIRSKYIKVSVKGTGTTTNSSCTLGAILTWA